MSLLSFSYWVTFATYEFNRFVAVVIQILIPFIRETGSSSTLRSLVTKHRSLAEGGGDHATPSEQFYRDSDLCVIRVSLHWQRCVLYLRGVPPGIWTLPRGCREGNRGWLKWSRKGQPCNVEVCKPWGRLIACAISSETWRGQNV